MTPTTILYEGNCSLCVREISFMRRLDRRGAISFVNVADEAAACLLDRLLLLERLHALENDIMLSGAAAIAAILASIDPRIGQMIRTYDKFADDERARIKASAAAFLGGLNS